MNFPTITEESCPEQLQSCPDPRCSDPAFAQANPSICGDVPTLILKPENLTVCSEGEVQFKAFLRSAAGEMQINDGTTFATSNSSVVAIDTVSGLAAVLAAGIVTISVTWSGMSAFAQVTVLAGTGGSCCADIEVDTAIVIDNSASMGGQVNGTAGTRLQVAKTIALEFAANLNDSKDLDGVIAFNDGPTVMIDLSAVIGDVQAAITAIPQSAGKTNLAAALEQAFLMVGFTAPSVPPSGVPPSSGGSSGGFAPLHGHGPPAPSLGQSGDTYVDDDTNALYWKSASGWNP